ncbi:signal transduction histidine kinase/PAS domain-containing protein [Actinoplanes tereljensis]|uniref:ATP-binding protein n=1 Tax=Paractinoplanes tereljensis TaxID=571912 RepID=UPI001EF1D9F8|nr:ATP-binding protein [Actinoplanes tereljensis]
MLADGLLNPSAELHRGVLTSDAADQLAALVARAANAPVGLIHFAQGGRLRLHGGWGLSGAWNEVADTPIDESLAGLVLDSDDPILINDLAADERVVRLGAAHRGAYIGHSVRDPHGAVLGVCCACDTEPRQWTAGEIAAVAEAAQVCTLLITEQLARHEIDQQRRFLDAVLDSLHDGVTACDADGEVVFVNERMRQMWEDAGLPGGDLPLDGFTDADGRALSQNDLGLFRALRGDHLRDDEVILHGPDRRTRHYLIDAHPITGPDGHTVGAVQAVQDVTRRRRVERFRTCELAVTMALADAPSIEEAGPRVLEAVVDTLGWAHAELWLVDEAAAVVRSAAQWSAPGWDAEIDVPVDLPYGTGLAGRVWQVGKPLWIRDVGQPQSLIAEETAHTSRLHAALAVPVREGFETLGVLTVFADTVEDPEDELLALMSGIAAHIGQFVERRLVDDLQRQLNRSKNEYLALIGHELRTPLTSISAYTELLREADEKTLVAEGPRLLEVIDRNTNQLRHIITELMELSALDAGHADVQLAPMDLAEVVRDSVSKARTAIDGAPLVIDDELPEQLVLPGDRKRLRQVVDNLLGNAVKYSPDGGRIGVTLRSNGRAAELAISDTGLGVTADEREKLFTGLYRTSRARDKAIPGTGLGMTLSRAVVSRHHGSIELVDHEGAGTTVLVRLPMDAR